MTCHSSLLSLMTWIRAFTHIFGHADWTHLIGNVSYLLSSFTSFKEGEIPITFILVVIFFIGQQIWEGITVQDNISNRAHIVGEIIGGALGYGLNKKSRFSR